MSDALVSDVRLVLLGTGTSAGVPVIGCDCPTCTSDDPRDRRTRSGAALLFKDEGGHERVILLDCGPDHREHSLRLRLKRVDAILFTHDHVDHTFGLDDVRRIAAGAPQWLAPDGWLIVEIGADQGERAHRLLADAGLVDVAVLPDLAGLHRFVVGRNP